MAASILVEVLVGDGAPRLVEARAHPALPLPACVKDTAPSTRRRRREKYALETGAARRAHAPPSQRAAT